jgi:hypothetical protein
MVNEHGNRIPADTARHPPQLSAKLECITKIKSEIVRLNFRRTCPPQSLGPIKTFHALLKILH